MKELNELRQKVRRLHNLIDELENQEETPKIFSAFPKERVREQIISKLTTDKEFERYLDDLPDYLVGNLKLKLTYSEHRQPDEICLTSTGDITRTIKSNTEREDYKGKRKYNLTRDAYGGLYDDE